MHDKSAYKNNMDILYTSHSKIITFSSKGFYKFLVNFQDRPVNIGQFFVCVVI